MNEMSRSLCIVASLFLWAAPCDAQRLTPALVQEIDQSVAESLRKTATPAASVVVVSEGRLLLVRSYGAAADGVPATTQTRFGLGSVSKQFTAAAVLLLAEQGKLSLDDKVARWYPYLTGADEISVRQLLAHTSGYQDYFPQIAVPPMIRRPTTADEIIYDWARRPLAFAAGSKRQYSNTGYVLAGRIVEKVARKPLFDFMREHIFSSLQMRSVVDNDAHPIKSPDAERFTRAALGPVRRTAPEGTNWMFGAGMLAMTASDLAAWDVSLMNQSLLTPVSYQALTSETVLPSGKTSGYGLGLHIERSGGRLIWWHDGQISGYLAINRIFPEQKAAVIVMTNTESGTGYTDIADRLSYLLIPADRSEVAIRNVLASLRHGIVPKALLTPNAQAYFDPARIKGYRRSLYELGPLRALRLEDEGERGGMNGRVYRAVFATRSVSLSAFITPDNKVEELIIQPFGD